jgi:peptide deformylase
MTNDLQMKLCGDLVLREKCAAVDNVAEIAPVLDQMVAMMEEQKGVGLSAPQVGIARRFIVMKKIKNRDDTGITLKMLNPRIVSKSEKTCVKEEGCLSVVDKTDTPIFADVTRPSSVIVEWTDENGDAQHEEMSGFSARIVQHEIDHLDGILFIDYLSPTKREMVMRKVKKRK